MQVLIRDLAPGTRYRIQVRSKNSVGAVSGWSRALDFNTIVDNVPPAPVNNLQAVVKPRGSFQVTWDAPTTDAIGQPLYDLHDYVVVVSSLASPYTNTYATTSNVWDFSFEMNYGAFIAAQPQVTFTVYARDLAGNMSTGQTAFATNLPPSNVTGFDAEGSVDSIAFNWDANTDVEDDIAYYLIKQGDTNTTIVNSIYRGLTIPATWETINTALQWFNIVAVDLFGQASPTPAVDSATARSSLTVDVTPPGVPTAVTTTYSTDTSDPSGASIYVDINWTPPSDTDIQEYVIRYSTNNVNWNYVSVPAENPAGDKTTTARINGLIAGQSYYIAVQAVDYTAGFSAFANSSTYPLTTNKDTSAPSIPAAPTVAANTMQIQVSHGLQKAAGGNLETDLHHLEVYASTTTGFTPAAANKLGDMVVVPPPSSGTPVTAIQTFSIPASAASGNNQTWFVKVMAVDNTGNKSASSAQSNGSVTLISTTNIQDATITDAKIATLSASKITAGSGFLNDITVKSIFTLGDGSTNGVIQSFDYVPNGTTGWKIEKGSFTVNNGSINARALNLQDGENILHPAYTDFEFAPTWYTGKITAANGTVLTIQATNIRYNFQSLQMVNGVATNGTAYLAPATNAYNIISDPTLTYIISAWVYQSSGATKSVNLTAIDSTGANAPAVTATPIPSGAWTRVSRTYQTSGSATSFLVGLIGVDASSTFYWDGVQVEKQIAGSSTPSIWQPYSRTYIDGGNIQTGEIRSTAAADGVAGQPAWSINTAGNFQLGSGNVRGTLYVGPTNVTEASSKIRSAVYTAGSGGWQIAGDGTAEFNQVTVRGAVYATSGNFSNEIVMGTANTSAHYMRSFNYSAGVSGWVIRADGGMEFNTGTFRGAVTGATITGGIIRTAASGTRVEMLSSNYNQIIFWPGNGESIAADVRVAEVAADRFIQMYSPGYGGQRAHISVGAEAFGGQAEVDLVAPGGTVFTSAGTTRFTGTFIQLEAASNGLRFYNLAGGSSRTLTQSSDGITVQFTTSAARLKKDIEPLNVSVDELRQIEPVFYWWNTDLPESEIYDPYPVIHGGFIADQVDQHFPQAVIRDMVGDHVGRIADIEDRALLAGAYKMIQDLYDRIEALESRP